MKRISDKEIAKTLGYSIPFLKQISVSLIKFRLVADAQLEAVQTEVDEIIRQHQLNLDGTVATYESRLEEIRADERKRIGKWLETLVARDAKGNRTLSIHQIFLVVLEKIPVLKEGKEVSND